MGDSTIQHFPQGFLWGAATAAHQVEGNNFNNDWWQWEQKGSTIRDGSKSGAACNWWETITPDLENMVQLHQNSHRLSIEWSRIEPQEGKWDEAAIDRYREMLKSLRGCEIEPMVTLHHFTNPLWLANQGGWESDKAISLFERYVTKVVSSLGEFVHLWITINEPNVYALHSYNTGEWPPGKRSLQSLLRVMRNMLLAHGAAYHAIHATQKTALVGVAHQAIHFSPALPRRMADRFASTSSHYIYNEIIATAVARGRLLLPLGLGFKKPQLVDAIDFIGINYYTRNLVRFNINHLPSFFVEILPPSSNEEVSEAKTRISPAGLYKVLSWMRRYNKPIYITENGVVDSQDTLRPRFLLTHLAAVHKAIQEGVTIKGYFHWSLIDNFEWAHGWSWKYGLIEVDEKTQARKIRPSGLLYSQICEQNGISDWMLEKYAPELLD